MSNQEVYELTPQAAKIIKTIQELGIILASGSQEMTTMPISAVLKDNKSRLTIHSFLKGITDGIPDSPDDLTAIHVRNAIITLSNSDQETRLHLAIASKSINIDDITKFFISLRSKYQTI